MTGYGQFCAIARAHEILGGRWTLLIVREVLMGATRFSDFRKGVPRISRTVLAERLQDLVACGVLERDESARGPTYRLTPAGRDLEPLVLALGTWGQKWLPRHAAAEDLDLDPLLHDMARRVSRDAAPAEALVLRFEIRAHPLRFMLMKDGTASVCGLNPGFPEPLSIGGPLAPLVGWWRGDTTFAEAQRLGLRLEGPRPLVRAFPLWFERYLLADVAPQALAG
ncbi:winged helix-turn-helix transcriptional regulator [Prosthecomicrobium sp. N25]|uniref:winged helix-turn-helix transcriptional regulator n=1 Tax=Prosthecomicrobium sp. N25 TaxID=3129254 RepID=UPI003076B30C